MLNLHTNPRRLAVSAGLFLVLTLATAPKAAAVPVLPDGGYDPAPQVAPGPGASDPAPALHASSNSLDRSGVPLAVAVGLTAFAITATALFAATGRRPVIANWSRPGKRGDRQAPLPRF